MQFHTVKVISVYMKNSGCLTLYVLEEKQKYMIAIMMIGEYMLVIGELAALNYSASEEELNQ